MKPLPIFNESIINLFRSDLSEKKKYADEVFEILTRTYAPIGGIKGNGFSNAEEMTMRIPMWKLVVKDGSVVCCILYKDKDGRKMVAAATDGSSEGKTELKRILKNEFNRSYFEVSDPLLGFMSRNFGQPFILEFAIKPSNNLERSSDPHYLNKYPMLKDFFYYRKIGDTMATKISLGTMHKPIIESFSEFVSRL